MNSEADKLTDGREIIHCFSPPVTDKRKQTQTTMGQHKEHRPMRTNTDERRHGHGHEHACKHAHKCKQTNKHRRSNHKDSHAHAHACMYARLPARTRARVRACVLARNRWPFRCRRERRRRGALRFPPQPHWATESCADSALLHASSAQHQRVPSL